MNDLSSEELSTDRRWRLADLLPFLRRRWPEVLRTAGAGIVSHLAMIATLGLAAHLASRALLGIGDVGGSLAIAIVVTAAGRWAQSYWGHDLAFALVEVFQLGIFDGLERAAPAYILGKRTGTLASTATQDALALEGFYAHLLGDAVGALVAPAVTIAVLLFVAPSFAILLAALAPFVGLLPFWFAKRSSEKAERARRHLENVSASTVEFVQGLPTILTFGAGEAHIARIDLAGQAAHAESTARARTSGYEKVMTELLLGSVSIAALALGISMVDRGQLAMESLPLLVVASSAAMLPLTVAAESGRKLASLQISAGRVLTIFHQPARVTDPSAPVAMSASPEVYFEDVGFDYGVERGEALAGVSFRVPAGSTVALVGASGAGKSTCANLLLRFWDPTSGRITLGGTDIRRMSLESLRRAVAWVPQNSHVFDVDVIDNVRLGEPDATFAQVERAVVQAELEEFVTSLPDGYRTRCGERGARVSGGQRQRLAIARAFLKDASVLLLDEPTSSLDADNEEAIMSTIRSLREGRTTIIISHRMATIRSADRIVVLDRGRVAEEGTYAELLSRGGHFAKLVSEDELDRVSSAS